MADFWELEDSGEALPTNGSFESGGGDFDPIPAKTQVLAALKEIKWDEYEGKTFINGTWIVLAPAEYKGRMVFQKLHVRDADTKKRDKAKRMTAAIDANAGGKLIAAGGEPTNENMTRFLCNKPMMLMLQVWEFETDDGSKKRGNWVSAVAPKGAAKQQPTTTQPAAATQSVVQNGGFEIPGFSPEDDDVGF